MLRQTAREAPVFGRELSDGSSLTREGDVCVFVFPDKVSKLVGRWNEDGLLNKAVFQRGDEQPNKETEYTFEHGFPGLFPKLACPYESQYVYVKQSSIPNSGEGVFAKVDLPPAFLATYYTGEEVSLDVIYARSWEENCNTILPDDCLYGLDAKKPFDKVEEFCGALGHKVNHNVKRKNCRYVNAYHPRFGHISSVVTICAVRKDEELFVDYEFNDHWEVPWFGKEEK